MLNGEAYIWMLGYSSGYEGFHIYKLNSDNSAWEVVYNIADATSYNTKVTIYLNNVPDTIFQGKNEEGLIRDDGTFDLVEFSPETLYYSQISTPTIVPMKDDEKWYYHSHRHNDIGQTIFFFRVMVLVINGPESAGYEFSRYICVLKAIDGSPVLYSTFKESDITGLIE